MNERYLYYIDRTGDHLLKLNYDWKSIEFINSNMTYHNCISIYFREYHNGSWRNILHTVEYVRCYTTQISEEEADSYLMLQELSK